MNPAHVVRARSSRSVTALDLRIFGFLVYGTDSLKEGLRGVHKLG